MRISDWSSDVCSSDLELQRAIDTLGNEALDWEAKAELAVSKDRDDLARGALSAKRRATERIEDARRELKQVDAEVGKLDDDIGKLRAKLSEARSEERRVGKEVVRTWRSRVATEP